MELDLIIKQLKQQYEAKLCYDEDRNFSYHFMVLFIEHGHIGIDDADRFGGFYRITLPDNTNGNELLERIAQEIDCSNVGLRIRQSGIKYFTMGSNIVSFNDYIYKFDDMMITLRDFKDYTILVKADSYELSRSVCWAKLSGKEIQITLNCVTASTYDPTNSIKRMDNKLFDIFMGF